MALKDLREYIARLEQEGELQRVAEEVDWYLEVGAIIRRSYDLQAAAPLFEKVKGYPKGYRILGAPVAPSGRKGRFYARMAISLGLSPETGIVELIEEMTKAKHVKPIKPRRVSTGPCKENIQVGNDIDLLKFPVPYVHSGDGGRHIGTWHTVVTKDPDTGWTNWGMYRVMVHDSKSMGIPIYPGQHIGVHYFQKYKPRNQPMPVALAIGTDPLTSLITSLAVPAGMDEADIVGGLLGEPLEVVKCETIDLEVPATSEIVIEGYVSTNEQKAVGPFGEFNGYQSSNEKERPVIKVTAVTHRNAPILPVVCAGAPIDDHFCWTISGAADILDHLRSLNYPVKRVFIPPYSGLQTVVISAKTESPHTARLIAQAVWATKTGSWLPKIIVVDDDIDATNMDEVFWAFSTRNHPERGIYRTTNTSPFLLWSFLSPEEKKDNISTNILFDCTWPKDWPKEYIPRKATFEALWPRDIQEKVLGKWHIYGYGEAQNTMPRKVATEGLGAQGKTSVQRLIEAHQKALRDAMEAREIFEETQPERETQQPTPMSSMEAVHSKEAPQVAKTIKKPAPKLSGKLSPAVRKLIETHENALKQAKEAQSKTQSTKEQNE